MLTRTQCLLAAALMAAPLAVQADTLADVRGQLAKQGQSALKATIEVKSLSRNGEGKELEERTGEAAVQVEDGLPLAARTKEAMTGRAFLVFSFEQEGEEEHQFGLLADRLVLLKSESRNQGSGTIGKNEQRVTPVLKPQA